MTTLSASKEGILLIDKPKNRTSFYLVSFLRKLTSIRTIGHAGTLDPIATGVMVLLIGKKYTRYSQTLTAQDKEYKVTIQLGIVSDSYDAEGLITPYHPVRVPSMDEIHHALTYFQGTIQQIPPMFSAKKVAGKKLYELARQGIEIERQPVNICLHTTIEDYSYPFLSLHIACSKGTYIRSIAHELGQHLGTGGVVVALQRTKSGAYHLEQCIDMNLLESEKVSYTDYLIQEGYG